MKLSKLVFRRTAWTWESQTELEEEIVRVVARAD